MRNSWLKTVVAIVSVSSALGTGLGWLQTSRAATTNQAVPSAAPRLYLTQADGDEVLAVLQSLPTPDQRPGNVGELFSANAYGQQALNFQVGMTPEPVVGFYESVLTEKGYSEREINRVVGDWGFNLVFDVPETVEFAPQDGSKDVVLVLQGTMLGPETININIRFEEI
ncbi:MAG: hypothetical protein HC838_02470 [Spirulinaceae cyanobacterium RM2_2_10]|nr:hypothetical protein [Spirulinaceae cyanobacterium SM2_1_0]NJO19153.1 hypothetical protein [Spirulinaceae cyanobacterium RM2_2_10]